MKKEKHKIDKIFGGTEKDKQIFTLMRVFVCTNKVLLDIIPYDEMLMCHIYYIEFCLCGLFACFTKAWKI